MTSMWADLDFRISSCRDHHFHVNSSPLTAMDLSAIKDNQGPMSDGNPWKQ